MGHASANAIWTLIWCFTPTRQGTNVTIKNFKILIRQVFTWTSSLKHNLTSKRLKLHEAAATAAVQDSVLGDCGKGLSTGSNFSYTVACIVHSENRT